MQFSLFRQKLVYALATSLPLSWSAFLTTLFFSLREPFFAYASRVLSYIGILQHGDKLGLVWQVFLGAACLVGPWLVYACIRWIPTTIQIPRKRQKQTEINLKLSTTDVMDRKGLLVLSYNRNNLIGGAPIAGKPNLFAQFMNRYFSTSGDNRDFYDFDWAQFVQQYESPDTFVMYTDENSRLQEFDKSAVPPKSVYKAHHSAFPESKPSDGCAPLLPEGAVIFLKLPPNSDHREYAVLLCTCQYCWPKSKPIVKSDFNRKCLVSLWDTLTKSSHQTHFNGVNVCLPLIGTGKISNTLGAYGAMWTVIQTARENEDENGKPHYCINICIPVAEMQRRGLYIWDVVDYLSNAVVG